MKITVYYINGDQAIYDVASMEATHLNGFIEYKSPEGKIISINARNVLSIEELGV